MNALSEVMASPFINSDVNSIDGESSISLRATGSPNPGSTPTHVLCTLEHPQTEGVDGGGQLEFGWGMQGRK